MVRKLLFDHIEKCGGRTVIGFLRTVYADGDIELLEGENQYEAIERAMQAKSRPCIAGHGAGFLIPFFPSHATAVILREPIARVVSLYRFCKQEGYIPRDRGVAEFIEKLPSARNYYAWRFGGMLPATVATMCPTVARRRAIAAILAYDHIGFTDDMAGFIDSLGFESTFPRDVIANKTTYTEPISDEDMELIRQANMLDICIFQAIRDEAIEAKV
ncbi:MAG: hypothetical protein ACO1RT_20425 [Planctomycetaceae bacterium]